MKDKEKYSNAVYPYISDRLIQCLQHDFEDKLPRKYKDSYELGILIGQQQVIDKLIMEKNFREEQELIKELKEE